ncbi:AMP-binding protein [Leptospira sp. 96542]|nr:AMP-binding protein [Leptospira sp. 96542]
MTNPDDPIPGFTPFPDIIAAHAQARPEAIAVRVDERAHDWRTLHGRVQEVARALLRDGIAPGDRVALLGAASLAYVECLFGAIAVRACVVPLPVSASVETLEALLADCEAKLLFVDPDAGDAALDMTSQLAARAALRVVPFGRAGAEGGVYAAWRTHGQAVGQAVVGQATQAIHDGLGAAPLPRPQAEDPFNIIYSSGTTGLPKGIVHLHGMRQRQASRKGFFTPQARTLLSTPMYSNTTLMPLLGTVASGGTTLLMRKFDAGRYLALATSQRATHTMLVPVQYQRLLAHADFAGSDLSSLELSQSTGAPMDLALKSDILQRWPGRFLEVYGMTEGGGSCFLDARAHPDKLATVGRPAHGSEVFLIDEAGRRLPEAQPGAAGAVGEVVGRSPYMMAGYHNRPEATAQLRWLDEEGRVYHRSGDIGRFDEDGFLVLLDRIKDVIISGGHNIYASDLEAVLARHADVADSAVIGVPSPAWGETPLALVVPKPGARLDPDALRDWVNAQVGKTQRLTGVELRAALPRNALGKLSKKELRTPYWDSARQEQTKAPSP